MNGFLSQKERIPLEEGITPNKQRPIARTHGQWVFTILLYDNFHEKGGINQPTEVSPSMYCSINIFSPSNTAYENSDIQSPRIMIRELRLNIKSSMI